MTEEQGEEEPRGLISCLLVNLMAATQRDPSANCTKVIEDAYSRCPLIDEMILKRIAQEWVHNACVLRLLLLKKKKIPKNPILSFMEETNHTITFLGFRFTRDGQVLKVSDVRDAYVPYMKGALERQREMIKGRDVKTKGGVLSVLRLHITTTLCLTHFPTSCPDKPDGTPQDGILDKSYTEFTVPCPSCNKTRAIETCGGCGITMYCSRECQREHRKEHKQSCKAAMLYATVTDEKKADAWLREKFGLSEKEDLAKYFNENNKEKATAKLNELLLH